MLVDSGADEKPTDMFAKKSEDYLNNEEGISIKVLHDNSIISKPMAIRRSRRSTQLMNEQQSWSKTNSTKSVMHRSNIKELIKQGNLAAIEEIVIQGFGDRLIGETSSAPLVQEFLDRVPAMIEQIQEIHKAAIKNNVNEFKSLDRKGMVLARDQIGATPLHKAVLYGHQELTDYIANNFPITLDARDHEGRTALHYAAVLDDDRIIFNRLVKAGASPILPDYRGKSADFYLRYPDQLHINQLIKRSQRLNANYAINTANRVKSKSPLRKRGWSPNNRKSESGASGPQSEAGLSDDQECGDLDDGSSNGSAGSAANVAFSKPSLRSRPANILPPSSTLKRFEVTSANLRKWIEEQDLEAIEGAILEGHGERVRDKVEVLDTKADTVQNYLEETFPKIMNKIRIIHAAVSCGDINGLQSHLDKNDYALAKDHLGMAPLHKAVILGHIDVVEFILEKFPETINARDREGRTALHYAAATTNRNGTKIYKILLRAGADPRVRDSNNKTAEYYRVHLLPLPSELSKLSYNSKRRQTVNGIALSPITKRKQFLLPSIQERITNALHDGDAVQLQELVLEGYGDAIIGRSSWGEEARKFLRNLPHFMDNIKSLQASIANGNLTHCEQILQNENYLRAKDENGLLPIHAAVSRNEREIVEFILKKAPNMVNIKDHYGRSPLHIAAQNKYTELYKKLLELGGDPMILDLKGRTSDHYLKLQSYKPLRISNNSLITKVDKNSALSTMTSFSSPAEIQDNADENYENDFEKENSDTEDVVALKQQVKEQVKPEAQNVKNKVVVRNKVKQKEKEKESSELDKNKNNITNAEINTNGKIDEVRDSAADNEIINESATLNSQIDNDDADENKSLKTSLTVEAEDKELMNKANEGIKTTEESESIANECQTSEKKLGKRKPKPSSQRNSQNSMKKQMTVPSYRKKASNAEKKSLVKKASLPTMDISKAGASKTKVKSKFADEDSGGIENAHNSGENIQNTTVLGDSGTAAATLGSALIVAEKVVEHSNSDAKAEMEKNMNGKTKEEIELKSGNEPEQLKETSEEQNLETTSSDVEKQKGVDAEDTVIETNEDIKCNQEETYNEEIKLIDEDIKNEQTTDQQTVIQNESNEKMIAEDDTAVDYNDDFENDDTEIDESNEVNLKSEAKNEITDYKDEAQNKNETPEKPSIEMKEQKTITVDEEKKDEDKNDVTMISGSAIIEDGKAKEEITLTEINESVKEKFDEKEKEDNAAVTKSDEENIESKDEQLKMSEADRKQDSQESKMDENDVHHVNDEEEKTKEIQIKETVSQTDLEVNIRNESIIEQTSNETEAIHETSVETEVKLKSEHEVLVDNKDLSVVESSDTQPETKIESEQKELQNLPEQVESTEREQTSEHLEKEETLQNASSTEIKSDEITNDKQEHIETNKDSVSVEKQEAIPQNANKTVSDDNKQDANEMSKKEEIADKVEEKTSESGVISEVKTEASIAKEKEAINKSMKAAISERRKSERSVQSEGTVTSNDKQSAKEKEYDQHSWKSLDGRNSEMARSPVNADDRLNDLIEKWFREGDLLRLEHVVIAGQGERLVGRKSDDRNVQEFLDLVPAYMTKIKHVHETVVRGNFNEVRHVLTRKRFALSRDQFGASPLHLAVLHGHMDVLVYIITQFPETIDGPDNEGRTALHYAAVIGEEDIQYFEILKKAGAKDNIVDKLGNTASYYLQNPGVLTIRELLENYKQEAKSAKKEPEQVDVWRRPPTADIESQLTPTSSTSSPEQRSGSADSQNKHRRHKREVSALVHVDADIQEATTKEDEENAKMEIESITSQFEEALKEEKERLQENFDKVMQNASSHGPESLNGDTNGSLSIGSSDSDFNLCQVKNEKGQTILHLAASKPQKRVVLYKMLSQAEYLIPERDVKYRTIRDIAIDKQLKQNVVTIDAYVLDAFVKGNIRFVQKLSHDGYDLMNIVDSDGNDVISVLRRNNITSMITLLEDITYFQKSKNELHTFIKNDYADGVRDKTEIDATLITAKNRRGRCALHIAALFTNVEVVEYLVRANPASVHIQDNLGRTALHYAMANSRVEEMAKVLVDAGANRFTRDVQMRTPSYYFVYKDEIKEIRREEQALE